MRKIILRSLVLCGALFGAWQASAQLSMTGVGGGFGGGTVTSATFTATANPAGVTPNAGTYDFGNLAIGTASANRVVVVSMFADVNTPSLCAVTIGGTTASVAIVDLGSFNNCNGIWYLPVTSGTTVDITVNADYMQAVLVTVGVLTTTTTTPASTNKMVGTTTSSPSVSISIPSNGAVVTGLEGNSATITGSFTNATQDYLTSATFGCCGGQSLFLAHSTTSGNPSYSGTSAYYVMVSAAWGP